MNKYIKRYLNSNSSYIPLEGKKLVLTEAVAEALKGLDAFKARALKAAQQPVQAAQPAQPIPAAPVAPVTPQQPAANQQDVIRANQEAAIKQQTATQPPQQTNINPNDPSLKALQKQNSDILSALPQIQKQADELMKAQAAQAQQQADPSGTQEPMVSKGSTFASHIEPGDKVIQPAKAQPAQPAQQQKSVIGIKPKVGKQQVVESSEPVLNSDTLELVNPYKLKKPSIKKTPKKITPPESEEESSNAPVKLLSDPIDFEHLDQMLKNIIHGPESDLGEIMGDNIVIQMPKNVTKADISIHFEKDAPPDLYGGEDKLATEFLKDSPLKPVSPVVMQQLKGGSSSLDSAMGAINAPQEILSPEEDPSGLSVVGMSDNVNALKLLDL